MGHVFCATQKHEHHFEELFKRVPQYERDPYITKSSIRCWCGMVLAPGNRDQRMSKHVTAQGQIAIARRVQHEELREDLEAVQNEIAVTK